MKVANEKKEKSHILYHSKHMTFWKDKAMETVQRSVVARSGEGEKEERIGQEQRILEQFKGLYFL